MYYWNIFRFFEVIKSFYIEVFFFFYCDQKKKKTSQRKRKNALFLRLRYAQSFRFVRLRRISLASQTPFGQTVLSFIKSVRLT